MVTLLPFQKEGSLFLQQRKKCLLADDMGLGKTIQAIDAIKSLNIQKALIFTTKSTIFQWRDEFINNETPIENIKIVNYEFLYHNYDLLLEDFTYDLIILDEAQKIKNYGAQITNLILSLPDTEYRWILTGTPIENKIEEILPLLEFLGIKDIYNQLDYLRLQSILMRPLNHRDIIKYNLIDELRLGAALDLNMLRREIKICPEKIVNNLPITMATDMNVYYEKLRLNILEDQTFTNALALVTKMRVFCSNPTSIDSNLTDNKLSALLSVVSENNTKNFVIFSEFRRTIDHLKYKLASYQLHTITGDTRKDKRQNYQNDFLNNKVQILLMTSAGEKGLNLQSGNFLIHYDLPLNPARVKQREGRLLRIGQSNQVKISVLYYKNSFEERILELLREKQELFTLYINKRSKKEIVIDKEFINWLFNKT